MTEGMAEESAVGRRVLGPHNQELGVVTRVYRDEATGYPEWIAVRIGKRDHVLPVGPTQLGGDPVAVAFDAEAVTTAPDVGSQDHLSVEDHHRLVLHYGLDRTNPVDPGAFERSGEPGAGHLPGERLEHGSSAD
jgi:hypothetical protein